MHGLSQHFHRASRPPLPRTELAKPAGRRRRCLLATSRRPPATPKRQLPSLPAVAPPVYPLSSPPTLPAAGKVKRALQAFFGATNGGLSVYDVAGQETVAADVLSGKAEEDRLRAVKGKGCVVDVEGGLQRMSLDSAGSMDFHLQHLQQQHGQHWEGHAAPQQQQQGAAAGEGRLRKLAVAVLGASQPSVADAIERATSGAISGGAAAAAAQGISPSCSNSINSSLQHSRKSSGSSMDMELALVGLPHTYGGQAGSSGSGAWGGGLNAGRSGSHNSSGSSSSSSSGGSGPWAAVGGGSGSGSSSRHSSMV